MPAERPKESDDTYQITDGEWLDVGSYKRHVCCDCLLNHVVSYRIFEGRTQEKWVRDDVATKKDRRRAAAKKRKANAKRTSRRST